MNRNINMSDISDGRLYELNDMVKADCGDCKGCHTCCTGMGSSVVLDPLDIYNMTKHLNASFEKLLQDKLELNVADGIVLPNLKMEAASDACGFLDENGRCSIHPARPSVCRLFPLGRIYENGGFKYFLQVHECVNSNRSKVKVKKWIDTPDLQKNQKFVCDWHYFLKKVSEHIIESGDDSFAKKANMAILTTFFVTPYDLSKDFYEQFYERFESVEQMC